MAESPKFPRLSGNRGRGTPSGVRDINLPEAIQFCSQDALRLHYRQITYEVTLSSDHYKNSSVIVDLAMGQIQGLIFRVYTGTDVLGDQKSVPENSVIRA